MLIARYLLSYTATNIEPVKYPVYTTNKIFNVFSAILIEFRVEMGITNPCTKHNDWCLDFLQKIFTEYPPLNHVE